ncbi:right-handed parallel beta-helix repeat-containing protein [bacterium]|nr:right-handed parallel beta-helix repeat-containing protein [bacterium]MBU1881924.1 right-handed parallel beta-helix repeat-containing protein [bacterium]
MPNLKLIWVALIIILGTVVVPTFAQPTISGDLSGSLGPGEFAVVGEITVLAGTTLTIMPGTTLLHRGHYTWIIEGQLTAEGTESDSIKFIREQPITSNNWGGIRFVPTFPVQNNLFYCVIDKAVNSGVSGGGIYIMGNHLTMQNCRVSRCYVDYPNEGGGIYAYYSSTLHLEECLLDSNTGYNGGGGIYLNYCNGATVDNCTITRNMSPGT